MTIMYTKTYTKEVHSCEHDKTLEGLESMKELGFITDIDRIYSEDGWELRGMVGMFSAWIFTGKWD